MKWFLYLISFCCIAAGSCFILYTLQFRDLLKNTLSKRYEKIISVSAIIVGLLLIISAFQAQGFWLIVILGVIAIGKGLFVLFNPKNSFDNIIVMFKMLAPRTFLIPISFVFRSAE